MPDALSKTVPIWITVLNRLVYPENVVAGQLRTPEDVVSASEHAQLAAKIDSMVQEARSLDMDLASLRHRVAKPMRPVWVTPSSDLDAEHLECDDEFATVVLCTASSRSSVEERNDLSYVQGAADDHEAWACGLTAVTFWASSETLLATSEDDLPAVIAGLLEGAQKSQSDGRTATLIKPTGYLWIGDNSAIDRAGQDFDAIICCTPCFDEQKRLAFARAGVMLIHLPCSTGKNGSRQLRTYLPQLERLQASAKRQPKVLVTCDTGKDIAVGVALAVICMLTAAEGTLDTSIRLPAPSKTDIKRKLSWIMVSMPDAAPSRATLQSVNAFLME